MGRDWGNTMRKRNWIRPWMVGLEWPWVMGLGLYGTMNEWMNEWMMQANHASLMNTHTHTHTTLVENARMERESILMIIKMLCTSVCLKRSLSLSYEQFANHRTRRKSIGLARSTQSTTNATKLQCFCSSVSRMWCGAWPLTSLASRVPPRKCIDTLSLCCHHTAAAHDARARVPSAQRAKLAKRLPTCAYLSTASLMDLEATVRRCREGSRRHPTLRQINSGPDATESAWSASILTDQLSSGRNHPF